jgi:kinesin family protein 4/21/27
MRLQEVLREREAEITILEDSLKERDEKTAATPPVLNTLKNGFVKVNGNSFNPDTALSPRTLNQFDHIRKSIEDGNGATAYDEVDSTMTGTSEADESLERLNELMLYGAIPSFTVIFTDCMS